jgi:hypothetical protein
VSLDWEINLDFDGLNERVEAAFPQALAAGLEVVKQVTTPLVPVRSGHLVGSPSITAAGDTGAITYPGPYARYQEYGVFYRHGRVGRPLSHTHGQSFYLTTGLVQATPQAIEAVAMILGRFL